MVVRVERTRVQSLLSFPQNKNKTQNPTRFRQFYRRLAEKERERNCREIKTVIFFLTKYYTDGCT